jgi:hypothetical protein
MAGDVSPNSSTVLIDGALAQIAETVAASPPADTDAILLERAGISVARLNEEWWPEVREMLRTRQGAGDMFVDHSPEGGLLVAPNVDPERVVRRCRALGGEVNVEQGPWRARRATVPPARRMAMRTCS